jgi:Rrf2 family protein
MILTTLEGYAIKALIYIATTKDKRATVNEISRNNNISFSYILRICSMLRENGVLESEKGRTGGYLLTKDPQEITLKEIIEAVGRESIEVKCDFGNKSVKCKPENCISLKSLEFIKDEIDLLFSNITLKDLVERSF